MKNYFLPYNLKRIQKKVNFLSYLCVIIFKILWTFAFFSVSYGIFKECQLERHVWIVVDIFNGLFGGVLLVYPFMNILNQDFTVTFNRWLGYLFLLFCLIGITLLISPLIGKGFI